MLKTSRKLTHRDRSGYKISSSGKVVSKTVTISGMSGHDRRNMQRCPTRMITFLIELAVAGNAESIITNNLKNLRNVKLQFDGLKVLAPEDFLRGN